MIKANKEAEYIIWVVKDYDAFITWLVKEFDVFSKKVAARTVDDPTARTMENAIMCGFFTAFTSYLRSTWTRHENQQLNEKLDELSEYVSSFIQFKANASHVSKDKKDETYHTSGSAKDPRGEEQGDHSAS